MTKKTELEIYIDYLEVLKKKLDVYFKDQKPFLKCKAGCDICCKSCYYPVSELEYEYVRIGINKIFNQDEKQKIYEKAVKIIKARREFAKTNNIMDFYYECPLIVGGACGIYPYRALLCRSHGLIYRDIENPKKHNAPYCMSLGLNYANVYDKETGQFSDEKAALLGINAKPQIYDLSYSVLMNEAGDINFGDVRMLVEWILFDIPNYKELLED